MAERHKRLHSPYTELVLCVCLSVLVASHGFPTRFYPATIILIQCLDSKQGLNAIALYVLTEKGRMPLVHQCPISDSIGPCIYPPVSYCRTGEGRAEAGPAAGGMFCVQTAGGAGQCVISP